MCVLFQTKKVSTCRIIILFEGTSFPRNDFCASGALFSSIELKALKHKIWMKFYRWKWMLYWNGWMQGIESIDHAKIRLFLRLRRKNALLWVCYKTSFEPFDFIFYDSFTWHGTSASSCSYSSFSFWDIVTTFFSLVHSTPPLRYHFKLMHFFPRNYSINCFLFHFIKDKPENDRGWSGVQFLY